MAHIKCETKDEYIYDYDLLQVEVEIFIDKKLFPNPKGCKTKNTIYIGAPYNIHIINNNKGEVNIYKSDQYQDKNNTKEFYFDDLNLHKITCKFSINFINIYKIICYTLENIKIKKWDDVLKMIYSYYLSTDRKHYLLSNVKDIIYELTNIISLYIPTFEERYGFSNMVSDTMDIMDIMS
jgi:hypothetical protein